MKGAKFVKCAPLSVPVIRRRLDRNYTMMKAWMDVSAKGRSILTFFDLSLFFLRGAWMLFAARDGSALYA